MPGHVADLSWRCTSRPFPSQGHGEVLARPPHSPDPRPRSWLSEPNGGEEFAYALLAASCAAEITTEHVYLALITPSDELNDDSATSSS
jgi:hypothetical protein